MAAPEPPGTASPKNIKVNGKYNRDTAPNKRCNIFFKLFPFCTLHTQNSFPRDNNRNLLWNCLFFP